MRKLLVLLIALLGAPSAFAVEGTSYFYTTAGQYTLSRMFRQGGYVGWPSSAADPFTCGAASAGISYYNTTSNENRTCNGTSWVPGGIVSPIAGDYVATGRWTFGASAGAGNAIDLQETAGCITFEGTTGGADAFEMRFCSLDVTGDRLVNLPDASGDMPLGSTVNLWTAGNTWGTAADAANSMSMNAAIAGTLVWEGATADDWETRLGVTDPTVGDQLFNFPNLAAATTDTIATLAANNTFTGVNWFTRGAGTENFVLGTGAGAALAAGGNYNVLIGNAAGALLTTADQNVFIGHSSGSTAVAASGSNVFVGFESGLGVDNSSNVLIGAGAGVDVDLGNVAVGVTALGGDTSNTMESNVAIGQLAGYNLNNDSDSNICIGYRSCNGPTGLAHQTDYTISMGHDAHSSADHQAVLGSDAGYFDNFYLGSGVVDATPTSVTLNATGGSGANIAGASATIAGGLGTGTGNPGNVGVSTGRQITTGSTLQTLETRSLVVGKTLALADEVATNVIAVTVPADTICSLTIQYFASYQDADEIGGVSGQVQLIVYEEPGAAATYVCQAVEDVADNDLASDAGTLTMAFGCAAAATSYLTATSNQEASDLASTIVYNVTRNSGCAVTPQ